MQYISNTAEDRQTMLKAIGVSSFEDLLKKVPSRLRKFQWELPKGISELELFRELVEIGRGDRHFHDFACYLGAGCYDHFIPTVVSKLAHRGEFITSYTPYQGEASQGILQFIYEYQTMICELTAMDYSNASMYDGASSLAEAVLLALRLPAGRQGTDGRKKILIPDSVHPEYREVVNTYVSSIDCRIVRVPMKDLATDLVELKKHLGPDVAAVVLQQPNFFGILEGARQISEAAKSAGALVISCVNPVSLGVIEPPGEYGADIAVGEGQPLGNAVSFGGPHFGFFTVKKDLLRKMPGRIAGATVDKQGRRSFVLTLQAREQHIRREKATSNICTNHSLCALKGAVYMSLLGPRGLQKLALINVRKAHATRERLLKIKGVKPLSDRPFFNEFGLVIDKDPKSLAASLRKNRILGPLALEGFYPDLPSAYLVAVTENRTDGDLDRLARAVEEA